eukprot:TRINITY_DN66615_c3_g1_i1.p1 TRINITY_DN66615_c3_g1~~TRINITY_DN66615_c3_g1_i1.p1  ORF type:complete len:732 (-),score=64.18 TRINITY_DN66615_c3_g1_i1:111-2000(-)
MKDGDYFYYTKTEEGNQYKAHCRKPILAKDFQLKVDSTKENVECGPEEVYLDENKLADGKDFCMVGTVEVSPNHSLVAWGVDCNGAEEYTIQVKDLKTGEMIENALTDKACEEVAWANDNKTLYYIVQDATKRPYKCFRHTIGEKEAKVVFEEPNELFEVTLERSKSGAYLYLKVHSAETIEIISIDANDIEKEAKPVVPRKHGVRYEIADRNGIAYMVTNEDAPNGKLLRFKLADGYASAVEEIAHDPSVKICKAVCYSTFVSLYMRKEGLGAVQVHLVGDDGKLGDVVALPTDGQAVYCLRAKWMEFNSPILRYGLQSAAIPEITYDFNVATKERAKKKQFPVLGGFNEKDYTVERQWATAGDGTKVPISIVYRTDKKVKNGEKDANGNIGNPLYLYGYGSYEISIDTYFNSRIVSLLDRGIVYAIAHPRGGGEMGRLWYLDGKYLKKKNSFTDFIDCGKHLIAEGWTTADRIIIEGRSAGGLLMGAVLNMSGSDICTAAIAGVPFVDVCTTMLDESIPLTVQEYEEWGNPNEKEYYDYMLSYSPVDCVSQKVNYPKIFVSAGLNDPRVGYWEPAKWVARLRDAGAKDVIFKCEMGSGHFSKSGRFDILKEKAYEMAFAVDVLGAGK